jgi:hypothetical protein
MRDDGMAFRAAGGPRDWRDEAACRDSDPELFFPEGTAGPARDQADQAKRICGSCPRTRAAFPQIKAAPLRFRFRFREGISRCLRPQPDLAAHVKPNHAAGAARPWPSVKKPTVHTDRPNRPS